MPPVRLVITVPGLLAKPPAAAPALAGLLAAAGAPRHEPEGGAAALAAAYAVERQRDWPLAALRIAALGIDPGQDYWLAADPVALVAGRADVRLEGAVADLSANDAAAIVATLNAHFAGDDLAFVAATPAAWFAHTRARPELATRALEATMRGPLRECLPRGADAPRWRRWQDEIQMLLHEHPVNLARERQGRSSANGIWFSQGGVYPRGGAAAIATYADEGIAVALARHAGSAARPLPATLAAALAPARGGDIVVVALPADADGGAIERDWLVPAWTALGHARVSSVTLIADGDGHAAVWTALPPTAWARLALRLRPRGLDSLLAAGRADEGTAR
jgi:hypothetical protein